MGADPPGLENEACRRPSRRGALLPPPVAPRGGARGPAGPSDVRMHGELSPWLFLGTLVFGHNTRRRGCQTTILYLQSDVVCGHPIYRILQLGNNSLPMKPPLVTACVQYFTPTSSPQEVVPPGSCQGVQPDRSWHPPRKFSGVHLQPKLSGETFPGLGGGVGSTKE